MSVEKYVGLGFKSLKTQITTDCILTKVSTGNFYSDKTDSILVQASDYSLQIKHAKGQT